MEACTNCQEVRMQELILPIVENNKKDPAMLIQILHETQEKIGYLPLEAQEFIAKELHIPVTEVYSVVTFYARFTTEPRGKHLISVCLGTACYVKGSNLILERLERLLNVKSGGTTEDKLFTLTSCRCVGACGLAPVMSIDEHVFGNLKPDMVDPIVAQFQPKEEAAS